MPDMDQGIKRLIQTHPRDILALAVPEAEYLGTLPADVATEPQLMLDTLMRVRYRGVECAVDLEAEARPRPDIGRRLFEYGARASIVTGLPVISVVLWLESGGVPQPSPYELHASDRLVGTWHFVGIEVYALRAQPLLERGLAGLLPLVPFTRDGADLAVVKEAARVVKERAAEADVNELEALLAVFASRNFGNDVALQMIRRFLVSTEILEQSPLYRMWIAKAQQEGLQQGLQQGLRESTLLVLRGRFGVLTPDIEQAVAAATPDALEELLAHVAIDSLEAIRARLGLSAE